VYLNLYNNHWRTNFAAWIGRGERMETCHHDDSQSTFSHRGWRRTARPDRVPRFDFLFQQPMYEELIDRRPGTYNAADAVALALALEHDAVWLPFGGFNGFQPQFLDANTYIDEWGTTFRHNDSSWPIDAPIDFPIKSRQDLARYRPPDPPLPGRSTQLEALWQTAHDQLALTGGVYGTPDDVTEEVREAIGIAAPGGGHVLASDHSLHDGIPIENIRALREAGLKYGTEAYRIQIRS
jgi:hypothetical protein